MRYIQANHVIDLNLYITLANVYKYKHIHLYVNYIYIYIVLCIIQYTYLNYLSTFNVYVAV